MILKWREKGEKQRRAAGKLQILKNNTIFYYFDCLQKIFIRKTAYFKEKINRYRHNRNKFAAIYQLIVLMSDEVLPLTCNSSTDTAVCFLDDTEEKILNN